MNIKFYPSCPLRSMKSSPVFSSPLTCLPVFFPHAAWRRRCERYYRTRTHWKGPRWTHWTSWKRIRYERGPQSPLDMLSFGVILVDVMFMLLLSPFGFESTEILSGNWKNCCSELAKKLNDKVDYNVIQNCNKKVCELLIFFLTFHHRNCSYPIEDLPLDMLLISPWNGF